MFLIGMKATEVLKVKDGVVRLAEDTLTNSYSIGLKTDKDMEWKYISKETTQRYARLSQENLKNEFKRLVV